MHNKQQDTVYSFFFFQTEPCCMEKYWVFFLQTAVLLVGWPDSPLALLGKTAATQAFFYSWSKTYLWFHLKSIREEETT